MSFFGGDSDMVLREHHDNSFSSESERQESDEFNAALTLPDTTDTWNSELHMCTDPKHVPLPWKLLPVAAPAQSFGEQNQDVASLLSVLQTVSVLSDTDENVSPSGTLSEHEEQRVAKGGRWWTQSTALQMCPLARFPIGMLPYPPFKFRKDPTRADPHRLVDGKYLALLLISSGDLEVCGRGLSRRMWKPWTRTSIDAGLGPSGLEGPSLLTKRLHGPRQSTVGWRLHRSSTSCDSLPVPSSAACKRSKKNVCSRCSAPTDMRVRTGFLGNLIS